ncbi:MAG: flippase [Bacteroidota bacterium]
MFYQKIKSYLAEREYLRKILASMSWLTGLHAGKMLINLGVGAYVTRYLGDEGVGAIAGATAFVIIASALSMKAIEGLVVRELNLHPEESPQILGSTMFLRAIGTFLGFLGLMVIIVFGLKSDSPSDQLLVAIVGLSMLFQPLRVISFQLGAQTRNKPIVIVDAVAFSVTAVLKIIAVWYELPVAYFAGLYSFELLLSALLMLVLKWRFSIRLARPTKKWMRYFLYYGIRVVLISVGGVIQGYIDQIMIDPMLGKATLGQYSKAFQVILMFAFLTDIIRRSVLPNVIEAKKVSEELFNKKMRSLYIKMLWLALGLVILLMLTGRYAITFIYGAEFEEAGRLLILYSGYYILLLLGMVRGFYLVVERLYNDMLVISLVAALVNTVANLFLIPALGVEGAILSTYLSFFVGLVVFSFIRPRIRQHLFTMIRLKK